MYLLRNLKDVYTGNKYIVVFRLKKNDFRNLFHYFLVSNSLKNILFISQIVTLKNRSVTVEIFTKQALDAHSSMLKTIFYMTTPIACPEPLFR